MLKRLSTLLVALVVLVVCYSCSKEPAETDYQYTITQSSSSLQDQAAFELYVESNGIPLDLIFSLSGESLEKNNQDAISQFNIVTSCFSESELDQLIDSAAIFSVSLIPWRGSSSDALATYTYTKVD